ncbi:hypothetical protein [Flavobacterium sp. ASW18X]|uniref:hypothetical protein n=1 Tax=Flavobacterium sp. ASW18X TaxID=2572595 RepID=UPI0010AED111|nr:hypothetical protein [Flavobacterium sp. ASW18X]TKD65534.1 hypothetical protein FBT53_05295 [Flavobacterium sp. ASW18X]
MKHFNLIVSLVLSVVALVMSCSNEQDFTQTIIEENTKVIEEELIEEPEEELTEENSIELPEDFNWENIPDSYANYTYWVIRHTHNLEGNTITLPEGITLYFKHGQLQNGTITGTENGIYTEHFEQVFNNIDLAGIYTNEYLKPYWFGAVMDGTTDDRDAFVETIAQSLHISSKVLIEKDMYVECLANDGSDMIFIDDNIVIEGSHKDVKVKIANQYWPVFTVPLSENVQFKNFTIEWQGSYDPLNWNVKSGLPYQSTYEAWLVANRGMTFNGADPLYIGNAPFVSLFLIDGAQNLLMEDVTIKAPDDATANKFHPWPVTLKSQYDRGSTVNDEATASVTQTSGLYMNRVTFDGTIMAVIGSCANSTFEGIRSYRYTDYQNEDGSNLGGGDGSGIYSAPPHLFYLNETGYNKPPTNINFIDIIDYGIYVGNPEVRPTSSGYCTSMTLKNVDNFFIDGYQSYRRDGFAGIVDCSNGQITNIYSESYNGELFKNITDDFSPLRLNGYLLDVKIENVTIKDLSEQTGILPITIQAGDRVTMNNVNLYVNEVTSLERNCLSFYGDYNRVVNSGLNIETFSDTRRNLGIIRNNQDTMENGSNNHYEVYVKGWRSPHTPGHSLEENMISTSYLAHQNNPNSNYFKITDVDNNIVLQNTNGNTTIDWTHDTTIAVDHTTSKESSFFVPDQWMVKKVSATVVSDLGEGTYFSLGIREDLATYWLPEFIDTPGQKFEHNLNEKSPNTTSNRPVNIYSNLPMNGQGELKVTMELQLIK